MAPCEPPGWRGGGGVGGAGVIISYYKVSYTNTIIKCSPLYSFQTLDRGRSITLHKLIVSLHSKHIDTFTQHI